jgi:hypothetical protein
MGVGLQPLRIPNGWRIVWNTLFEEDPTEPANANGYYFGGTNLFHATHERRRRAIDIEWRTEEGRPTVGRYRMRVLPMAEADPSSPPRRRSVVELEARWREPLADFQIVSRLELVAVLEMWLDNDEQAEPGSVLLSGDS